MNFLKTGILLLILLVASVGYYSFQNKNKQPKVKIVTPKVNDFKVGDCFLLNEKGSKVFSRYVKVEAVSPEGEVTVIESLSSITKEMSFFINRYQNPNWENYRIKCPVFYLKN